MLLETAGQAQLGRQRLLLPAAEARTCSLLGDMPLAVAETGAQHAAGHARGQDARLAKRVIAIACRQVDACSRHGSPHLDHGHWHGVGNAHALTSQGWAVRKDVSAEACHLQLQGLRAGSFGGTPVLLDSCIQSGKLVHPAMRCCHAVGNIALVLTCRHLCLPVVASSQMAAMRVTPQEEIDL